MGKGLVETGVDGFAKGVASGCFIATAAYGTPMAIEIDILRNWRDQSLSNKRSGRYFVKTYYRISPPIAEYISRSESRRSIVRKLLTPIIKLLNKAGF
jgi:hypothetical protein